MIIRINNKVNTMLFIRKDYLLLYNKIISILLKFNNTCFLNCFNKCP